MDDTIVAISTALGKGAISIIRLSGKDSIKIVNSVFNGVDLNKVDSHTINYGFIIDGNKKVDEVLVSVMKAPRTYTTEDVVEINSHGGIIATNKILKLMLKKGARMAEAGEFTKRAFLNGRIDLTAAESVMDIIESKSNEAMDLAMKGLSGSTRKLIEEFRENLIKILANIEVNIDYPEYEDIEEMTIKDIEKEIKTMKNKLSKILESSKNTRFIKDGINTVIVGRPNAGKSSILNKLLEEDKAIVTDIEGTTRDIVEGSIYLDGILLNIIDTAGIRETDETIEKIGVEKSLSLIEEADLIIVVLDGNKKLNKEDKEILERTKNKTRVVVVNKDDLKQNVDPNELPKEAITINTFDNSIDKLKDKIRNLFELEKINTKEATYFSNTRQIDLVEKSLDKLEIIKKRLKEKTPIDLIELDLKEVFDTLGEIIGVTYDEEIIDHLFENFCVGK
ncbi:MAG: tRNA uridine-5-carboxymethylaminomethyl(34) synthesis GTPase MnmE [Bacilli bacterium]|nr:tRNA uridine-5-carboxymethylaminomethyl(34) synthesis GTPase MnmE [Bacilli bacterium]